MKCQGRFVFKSLTHRDGGTFKNDKGEEINYNASYVLKVDEINEKGVINERKFKIDEKNSLLVNALKEFKAYQKILIVFEVTLYQTRTSLEIIDVLDYEEYEESLED